MNNNSFLITNHLGGIGPNILWPSCLPNARNVDRSSPHSVLSNAGTWIKTPTTDIYFPTSDQMSGHDASHINSQRMKLLLGAEKESITFFDATMQGETGADFFDHMMETVLQVRRNTKAGNQGDSFSVFNKESGKWVPFSMPQDALTNLQSNHFFVMPIAMHPENLKPENLVAYTIWDTTYDNLRRKLHLLPSFCPEIKDEGDFHAYANKHLASDIKRSVESFGVDTSANLKGIRSLFHKEYYGLDVDYQKCYIAAQATIEQWEKLIEKDEPIKTSEYLIFPLTKKTGLVEELYIIYRSADASLKCPVEAPTVKLKPHFYLNGVDLYKPGTILLEAVMNRLQQIGYDKKVHTNLLNDAKELEDFALMRLLNFFGEISYGFSILPKK